VKTTTAPMLTARPTAAVNSHHGTGGHQFRRSSQANLPRKSARPKSTLRIARIGFLRGRVRTWGSQTRANLPHIERTEPNCWKQNEHRVDARRRGGRFLGSVIAAAMGGLVARLQHGAEVERATDLLIGEAQRQIGLQYETADAQDLKTIGMIAAAIAGAAFVASAQHHWRLVLGIPVWALPLLLLVLAIGALVMSLWQQTFQRGPQVPRLYRSFSGTMMEAKGQILRELVEAIEHNRDLLPPKARRYAMGCWLLALAVVAAAVAIAVS
jgi:hypothetical protein